MFIFYSWQNNESIEDTVDWFHSKVRRIIIKEKHIAGLEGKGMEIFNKKWIHFSEVYQIFEFEVG